MSSFVISKSDYIKAAGTIAGIADYAKHGPHKCVFVCGFYQRRMEKADFYNAFVECFEMNAMSVYEQYKHHEDEEIWTDGGDYMKEFERYYSFGASLVRDRAKLREIISELHTFLQSAIYQTEFPAYEMKMKFLFNEILVALNGIFVDSDNINSWGSIGF